MRRLLLATALAGVTVLGIAPAEASKPSVGAVTTNCRVHVQGTWPTDDRFNAEVKPGAVRPSGSGPAIHQTPDGIVLRWRAETLLCRRDGGVVPAHGGANIADFTGLGTLQRAGEKPIEVFVQTHVEDRGEGERNLDDYWAVRATDPDTGDEIYFNANYLATGTVKLIPV